MIDWIDINEKPIDTDGEILLFVDGFDSVKKVDCFVGETTYADKRITHWAHINKPVKKRWMPNKNDDYYVPNTSDGSVHKSYWVNDPLDIERRNLVGVYKTKEEAEQMRDKIK